MNNLDAAAFTQLFKDAYKKCFGHSLTAAVTERESKLLSNQVIDATGLVIGFKSIKNYSAYIFNSSPAKPENPSVATLDTLSRYVLDAPHTDELQRKKNESHYPYWFAYKEKFVRSATPAAPLAERKPAKQGVIAAAAAATLIVMCGTVYFMRTPGKMIFSDDFHATEADSLAKKGWFVKSADTAYCNKRNPDNGGLVLFTLKADNWPDSGRQPEIRNLLLRKIGDGCFTAEVHLQKFITRQNWQQAGLILLEDTGFSGKSLHYSMMYNDYAGASKKSRQLIIQAITSLGKGFGKPEEIAHNIIAYPDSLDKTPALKADFNYTALRIEKHGNTFRLLFSGGKLANSAFREVVSQAFDMQPKYIGIFALKGFVDSSEAMPVHVRFFRQTEEACGD